MRAVIKSLCGALLLLSAAAWAETADRSKPVQIEADRVRLDDAKKVAVYQGNVILIQGSLKIQADQIDIRQDGKGFVSGVALGAPVTFRQKLDRSEEYVEGQASKVEYDAGQDLFKMTGSASLRRGQDEIHGNLITYDMRSGQYRAEGSVPGVGQGRVRAVIRPPAGTAEKAPAQP